MKKIIYTLLALICFLPICVSAKDKVKVYVFEAGGCPYCENEIEYLKSLDSYDKEFEIVEKELYVDHTDWEKGKDYELGVKVANAFLDAGYENATYQGTPFVVIGDIYAAAGYSTELEDYIKEAYENNYIDAVECLEKDGDNCITHVIEASTEETNETTTSNGSASSSDWVMVGCTVAIILSIVGMIITYIFKSTKDTEKIIQALTKKTKTK